MCIKYHIDIFVNISDFMASKTITLSVPKEVYEQMREHPEINYSELARERISEYLSTFKERQIASPNQFLVYKDLIFNREKIIEIHNKLEAKNTTLMGELSWIDTVFDLDMVESLAKFYYKFPKAHPFEDGNKRTAFVCIDSFLRLVWFRLDIKAEKDRTTEDEKFIWQNANQQKSLGEIKEFLTQHLAPARKPGNVETAISNSINENRQLLENLAAE